MPNGRAQLSSHETSSGPRPSEAEEEKLPFMGSKEFIKATKQELLIDFQNRIESGEVHGINHYARLLRSKGYRKHSVSVITDTSAFEKMVHGVFGACF